MLIDGFEDGDIDEYFGDTAPYSASQLNPFDGEYSLEATTTSSGSKRIVHSDASWGPGDDSTLHCWVNREHSAGMLFGSQSRDETYQARIRDHDATDAILELRVANGGSSVIELSVMGIDRTQYEWLRIGVDWATDGTITATAYDDDANELGTVSGTDTTYGAGGVGVGVFTSESVSTTTCFDNIRTVSFDASEVETHTALSGEFDPRATLNGEFTVRTTLSGATQ